MTWIPWMWVLLFVQTAINLRGAACWLLTSRASLGTFTPVNGRVCTGKNITYTCRLNHGVTRGTSADLVIQHDGNIVNPDQIQIKDNRTILYTIQNVGTAGTSIRLNCCLRNCSLANRVSNVFGEELMVLQAPAPVQGVQCVLYDWDIHMTCTWDLVVDYTKDALKTDINMQMRYKNYSTWNNCPELGEHNNQCMWSYSVDFTPTVDVRVQIRVQIKSKCGLNITSSFDLEDVKVIQPAPANLSVMVTNATCVNVTIGSQANNEHRRKNYRLTYMYQLLRTDTILENTTKVLLIREMDKKPSKYKTLLVCGLIPFAMYTFSVEVSPQEETKWLWSEPSLVTVETPSALPGASPQMLPEMFSWNRTECQAWYDLRTVHVYIQPIKEQFWNGERRSVHFKYTSLSGRDIGEDEDEKPTDVMCTSLRLRCDLEYRVSVRVRNSMGLSPDSSSIYIPAAGQVLDPPDFILETTSTDGVVTFEWIGGFPSTAKGYTVYQCQHDTNENCDDRSVIQRSFVESVNRSSVQISVGSDSNVLIGASIETDGNSAGIYWESCIYKHDEVPRKPTSVEVEWSHDNNLYITWAKLLCRPGEPYVSKYLVSYCKLDSGGFCSETSTTEVPSDKASIMLRDLDGEHTYTVYVTGIARSGNPGYRSDHVIIRQPIDQSSNEYATAGMVVGCVCGVAFALASFICIVRGSLRRRESQTSKPTETEINCASPVICTEEVKEFYRQQSNDSGLPQSPTIEDGEYPDNFQPESPTIEDGGVSRQLST